MRRRVIDTNVVIGLWRGQLLAPGRVRSKDDADRAAAEWLRLYPRDGIVTPVRLEFLGGALSRDGVELPDYFLGRFPLFDGGVVLPQDWDAALRLARRVPRAPAPRGALDCLIRAVCDRLGLELRSDDGAMPPARPGAEPMTAAYEDRLRADPWLMFQEISMHYAQDGSVFRTMRKLAARLDALGLPYAVVGGMALNLHGYVRATDDVDLVVTKATLASIHEQLEGLGWVPPFAGSKNLRDAETGVKIEFLVTGEYPGDGRPKPVSFPDPAKVSVEIGGVKVISLATLVELKLASGTAKGRRKDLGDVQEVIRALKLPAAFALEVDESVRPLFLELHAELDPPGDAPAE